MSNQPLFTPYRMGDLDLPNRIVMAPLTRMRAQSHDHVPTTLQAEYYAQRASAGLIITEATAISPEGFGWADTPGVWMEEQVRGWRRITECRPCVRRPHNCTTLAHRRNLASRRS
jgi:N-ethylmaleimide reductase